eukprot:COSAG06_NODE_27697_length_588_cov_0.809816_1_plen_33_part_01
MRGVRYVALCIVRMHDDMQVTLAATPRGCGARM